MRRSFVVGALVLATVHAGAAWARAESRSESARVQRDPASRGRSADRQPSAARELITPDLVRAYVVKLAGAEYEGRGAGYRGEREAAEFIASEFERLRLHAAGDRHGDRRSFFQEFRFHPRRPPVPWETLSSRNVLGMVEGRDSTLRNEIVVIGAHYDGQGRLGEADPLREPPTDPAAANDSIWDSANDNATGVAAVLGVANGITRGGISTKRSILFVAFGAEEHGMAGSIHYVNNPGFELGRHVAMVNLEKLGRAPEQPLTVSADASSSTWPEILERATATTGTSPQHFNPYVVPDSDHYAFAASGIPAVVFSINTQQDTHRPTDVAEKIDYGRVAEYSRFALAVTLELANRAERPVPAASRAPDLGLIAHLASEAEADLAGLRADEGGVKVTGVIADGPAHRAGFRSGDLVLSVAGTKFRRDEPLESLQKLHMDILAGKRGNRLPSMVLRDGQHLELILELEAP